MTTLLRPMVRFITDDKEEYKNRVLWYQLNEGDPGRSIHFSIMGYIVTELNIISADLQEEYLKDKIAYQHPAQFPEQMAADHIYSWSNEGDLVYDPFGGSGTTAKMAHLQKRNWILSEISAEYCEIARKRIAPYLAQTQLFNTNAL